MSSSIARVLRGGALVMAFMSLVTGCAGGGGGGGGGGGNTNQNESPDNDNTGGSENDNVSENDNTGGTENDNTGGTGPTVFLFATGNDGVVSYFNPGELEGPVSVNTDLESGASTDFFRSRDVAIDIDGSLHIASEGDSSITIFENAIGATGSRLPDRKVVGPATRISAPRALAIDVENDVLFVANQVGEEILVFDGASTAALDGDVLPSRAFSTFPGFSPLQMVFVDGTLYVSHQPGNSGEILAFDGASALEGPVNPDRTVTNDSFGSIVTVYVDAADRLLAVDGEDQVFIYNSASTRSGGAPPDVLITVEGVSSLSAVAADSNNVLYIADSGDAVIHVFDDIPSLTSGTFPPDRTFEGDFSPMFRLLVHEE